MPQKDKDVLLTDVKRVLKRNIEPEIYRKFSHFVYLTTPIIEPIPGPYSMYYMYKDGLAIATNALCINEWLTLHNLPTRRPFAQFTIDHRIKANIGMDIDNRTPEWTGTNRPPPVPRMPIIKHSEIRETVWDLYTNQNFSTTDIARALDCTLPNIYYHIKKKQKELDIIAWLVYTK